MNHDEILEGLKRVGQENKEILTTMHEKQQALAAEVKSLKARSRTAGMAGGSETVTQGMKEEIYQALQGVRDEQIKGLYLGDTKNLKVETKAAGDMLISTHLTGGTQAVSGPQIGPVGMTYRLANVRDLLRSVRIDGMYLPLLKDNGSEGAPAPTAEGAVKPDIDFDLAEATAKAEVIAGTTTVSKQFFDDVQNARGWLTDRLVELYDAVESDQLLNGSGVAPNLKGLNTSGNFTAATGTATVPAEKLIQAILQMRILKRRPSGIIINPANIEELILNKATGSGEYDLPSMVRFNDAGQLFVMGVPVVDIAEQPADTFTLHDNTGSLYAVRQGLTIEFFNEIFAKTNKILIRIESRIAFPNFGPTYTIKGSF